MKSKIRRFAFLAALTALALPCFASPATPQARLSDKDVEQRLKNLNDDTKKFRSTFNNSVSKSTIRKTSQEKDAKKLVETFQKQNSELYEHFKKTKKADPYLQNSLNSADQIDKILHSTQLDSATNSQWARVKSQLGDLGKAFQMPGY